MADAPALSDAALEAHLDAALAVIGLAVEPDARASTLAHLKATLAAGRLVAAFPLGDDVEPAPAFRP